MSKISISKVIDQHFDRQVYQSVLLGKKKDKNHVQEMVDERRIEHD